MNYTRIHYFTALDQYYVVQRHYTSINVETLYSNTTILVHIVCIRIPDLETIFLSQCSNDSFHYNTYVYFINYDGLVEYSVSCESNTIYSNTYLGSSVLDLTTMTQEYVVVRYLNLTDDDNAQITFLTDQFKNRDIFAEELLEQQNGTACYEQFEGGLLLLVLQLQNEVPTNQEIILQQAQELYSQGNRSEQEVSITFNEQTVLQFRNYRKYAPSTSEYDRLAQRFKQDNPELFADEQYAVSGYNPPAFHIVAALLCGVAMVVVYFV